MFSPFFHSFKLSQCSPVHVIYSVLCLSAFWIVNICFPSIRANFPKTVTKNIFKRKMLIFVKQTKLLSKRVFSAIFRRIEKLYYYLKWSFPPSQTLNQSKKNSTNQNLLIHSLTFFFHFCFGKRIRLGFFGFGSFAFRQVSVFPQRTQ